MRPAPRGYSPDRLVLLAALLVLGACGSGPYDQVLRIGHDTPPLTLDPHHHNDNATWSLQSNLYDGLVRFDAEMRLQPALAESWEHVDPTHLRFRLRSGVTFASGATLTPADVAASLLRARDDPASRIRYHLLGVRVVRAVDERTVELETARPDPTLLNRLAFVFVVPARDAALGEITAPDGTGPYRLVGPPSAEGVTLEGWAGWRGTPAIARVQFRLAASMDELATELLAGRLDVACPLPERALGELRRFPRVRAVAQPRLHVQMMAINPDGASGRAAEALADPRVRRALLAACDRERWVRETFRGAAAVASQCVHPVVAGYDPSIASRPYDPAAAKELLAEAGYAGGLELPIDYATPQRELVAAMVADLGQVGVRLEPHEVPWSELLRRGRAGQSAIMVFAWSAVTGDAGDFLTACAHTPAQAGGQGSENYSGYSDPATDALIDAADRELDGGRRLDLLRRAQRRLLDSGRVAPLTIRLAYLGVSDRVEVTARHDQWIWVAAFRWRQTR